MELASKILAGACAASLVAACSSSVVSGHGGGSRSAPPPASSAAPSSSVPSLDAPSSVVISSAPVSTVPSSSPATTTATVTVTATNTTTPTTPRTSTTPAGFVGTWFGHSRKLVVRSDGAVNLDFRTYVPCSATVTTGCDRTVGNVIHDGGQVSGRVVNVLNATTVQVAVTSTSVPREFAIGTYRLGHDLGHDALAFLGGGFKGVAFCGPRAPAGWCGA